MAVPPGGVALPRKSQPRLVDERCGLERVPRPLAGERSSRLIAQEVVDERKESFQRFRLAFPRCDEESGDVTDDLVARERVRRRIDSAAERRLLRAALLRSIRTLFGGAVARGGHSSDSTNPGGQTVVRRGPRR